MKTRFSLYALPAVLLGLLISFQCAAQPDLFISEFSLKPNPPVQGQPVAVRIGVYNRGDARSGPFVVQWWAGKNFSEPACSWTVDRMNARGGRILKCRYGGYKSWYGRLETVAVADADNRVSEGNEADNRRSMTISVKKATAAAPAPERRCSISGQATGARRDLANLFRITLRGPNDRSRYRATARFDDQHRYRFTGLPEGRYWVSVDTKADLAWGPRPSSRVVSCRGQVKDIDFDF